MRQAIVFQNNRFFALLKNPGQTGLYSKLAAEVNVGVVFTNFAIPVYAVNHKPCRRAVFLITIAPRSVSDDVKRFRASLGNRPEYNFGDVRAVEYKKCHWGRQTHWI